MASDCARANMAGKSLSKSGRATDSPRDWSFAGDPMNRRTLLFPVRLLS
jgi:hypothetical protein